MDYSNLRKPGTAIQIHNLKYATSKYLIQNSKYVITLFGIPNMLFEIPNKDGGSRLSWLDFLCKMFTINTYG